MYKAPVGADCPPHDLHHDGSCVVLQNQMMTRFAGLRSRRHLKSQIDRSLLSVLTVPRLHLQRGRCRRRRSHVEPGNGGNVSITVAPLATLICMRQLVHLSIEEITVQGILHALADPVRVAMFADIVSQGYPRACPNFLTVSDKAIPKSTLSQHFKGLHESRLIRSERAAWRYITSRGARKSSSGSRA